MTRRSGTQLLPGRVLAGKATPREPPRIRKACLPVTACIDKVARVLIAGLCLAVSLLLAVCPSPCESRRHGHAEKQHALSCRPDNEGSWSIGVYKGEDFTSLVPVEEVWLDLWRRERAHFPYKGLI